ncbi:S1 RNA-binding domain-containing protein [Myxococcota bacterium]
MAPDNSSLEVPPAFAHVLENGAVSRNVGTASPQEVGSDPSDSSTLVVHADGTAETATGAHAVDVDTPEPSAPEPGAHAVDVDTPEPGAHAVDADTPEPGAYAADVDTPEPGAHAVDADTPEPGAHATDVDTPEPGAHAADVDTPEPGAHAADVDTRAAELDNSSPASGGTDPGLASSSARKRKRRRKKKHTDRPDIVSEPPHRASRPASDRAPFHVGEEVFGKVTAVLDTAIMVDLSGKALAIFDRGEMDPDDLFPSEGDRFVARVHNDGARGGLVVLTRKPLREDDAKPKIELAAKEGTLVQGLVTGVIKGGVEVDIQGLRAFAPASGMDLHPANANLSSLLGRVLDFKVLQFRNAGRDLVVTRRPMLEAEAHERRKQALTLLSEGQVMQGVVRTVVEWGVFVALPEAENLEGLVHVSEASHDRNPKLSDSFRPGDDIEVKITKIDEKGKIWLSRKALIEDPWADAKRKYAPGSVVAGQITRLEAFGAFVELEPGVEGLLHTNDLSLSRIEHPSEVLSEGQQYEFRVHRFDQRDKRITLHLAPPPEQAQEEPQRVTKGATLRVQVVKIENSGVVARVMGVTGRAARGFIPAGQTGTARGTDLRKAFKVGGVLDVKVVDVDPKRGEPRLSIKGLKEDEERRAAKEYRQKLKAEGSFGTLGDLLASKLNLAGKGPND